jgi:hypothetical protein
MNKNFGTFRAKISTGHWQVGISFTSIYSDKKLPKFDLAIVHRLLGPLPMGVKYGKIRIESVKILNLLAGCNNLRS